MAVLNELPGTVNVERGAFEWNRAMAKGDTIRIKLRQIWSGKRGSKSDHTNFNLYNNRGQIPFHVSFRRHDQTMRFNSSRNGQDWGTETQIDFPHTIKDEKSVDFDITFHGDGLYTFSLGGGWTVYVDALESPNSLTYRASNDNDPMFGQNVDAVLQWYD